MTSLQGTEKEKMSFLNALALLASKNDLKCYGHGFESLSLTTCAISLGYQHVSGPAVAATVAQPGGIQSTAMEAIYRRAIELGDHAPT